MTRRAPLYGGIELGGTKTVCVVGRSAVEILASDRTPTSDPETTVAWAVERLSAFEEEHGELDGIGVASFGPVDLRPQSPTYGCLLRTPKPGWSHAGLLAPLQKAFTVPVSLASDVEGAALAEGVAGAAAADDHFVYITVGTGIGAGVVAQGRPVRGVLHPEIGHLPVPRQPGDLFEGVCPFHGNCLEGMACGPALGRRWGKPAEELSGDMLDRALAMEAAYLAYGLRAVAYSFAPQRIVIGGGVGLMPGLVPAVGEALAAGLAGYPGIDEFESPDYVRAAQLGAMAGPAGTLVLAQRAELDSGRPVG